MLAVSLRGPGVGWHQWFINALTETLRKTSDLKVLDHLFFRVQFQHSIQTHIFAIYSRVLLGLSQPFVTYF